jgi:hypothetical protein
VKSQPQKNDQIFLNSNSSYFVELWYKSIYLVDEAFLVIKNDFSFTKILSIFI